MQMDSTCAGMQTHTDKSTSRTSNGENPAIINPPAVQPPVCCDCLQSLKTCAVVIGSQQRATFRNHTSPWQFVLGATKVLFCFLLVFFFFLLAFAFFFPSPAENISFGLRLGRSHAVMSSVFEANWKIVRKLSTESVIMLLSCGLGRQLCLFYI